MKYLFWGIILIYVILHIPFLQCDPHSSLDIITRGAWTDEGIYTAQIRNLINHHYFSITENSTYVRGPLFNIIQLPFFILFGCSLLISRLSVLLVVAITFIILSTHKQYKNLLFVLIPVTLLELHVFSFSHYGLSEMMSISFIVLALFFLEKQYMQIEKVKWQYALYSALMVACAYYTKIQYAYIIVVLILTTLCIALFKGLVQKEFKKNYFAIFYWNTAFTVILALFYSVCWYLPNQLFYNLVLLHESTGRFGTNATAILKTMYWSFNYLFLNKTAELKFLFFIALAVVGISVILFKLDKQKKIKYNLVLIVFAVCWILVELHKLTMLYMPMRYMLGLIVAMGLLVASLIAPLLQTSKKYIVIAILVVITSVNISSIYNLYKTRTWQLQVVNNYLAKTDFKEQPVIGPWAASCTWQSKAITFPIWNNFLNYKSPIQTYHPRVVISEYNQLDSDFLYTSQNINLDSLADSSRVFRVLDFDVVVYWMK